LRFPTTGGARAEKAARPAALALLAGEGRELALIALAILAERRRPRAGTDCTCHSHDFAAPFCRWCSTRVCSSTAPGGCTSCVLTVVPSGAGAIVHLLVGTFHARPHCGPGAGAISHLLLAGMLPLGVGVVAIAPRSCLVLGVEVALASSQ
jgi:hypothetical protein